MDWITNIVTQISAGYKAPAPIKKKREALSMPTHEPAIFADYATSLMTNDPWMSTRIAKGSSYRAGTRGRTRKNLTEQEEDRKDIKGPKPYNGFIAQHHATVQTLNAPSRNIRGPIGSKRPGLMRGVDSQL